ncbi:hypothetical protein LV178_08015, partial [Burkholderia mallei]|nr:hypothetical protein [Burkholderia mallei]
MANGIRRVVALMPASVLLSLSRSLAAVVGIGIAAAVAPDGWMRYSSAEPPARPLRACAAASRAQ